MSKKNQDFIPALRFNGLTPIYDWVVSTTMPAKAILKVMENAMPRQKDLKIVDIGCGTGSLLRHFGDCGRTNLNGADADRKILKQAQEKNPDVTFHNQMAQDLEFESESFDVVTSTLFFHHLTSEEKKQAFKQINRILKPGGVFLFLDWNRPRNLLEKMGLWIVRIFDGLAVTRDHYHGTLAPMLYDVFPETKRVWDSYTVFGRVSLFRITKEQQWIDQE